MGIGFFIIGFIIWIILCFVTASIAKKRGRSVGGYVCLAIFLSPLLSIFILLILGDSEEKRLEAEEKITNAISKAIIKPEFKKEEKNEDASLINQLEQLNTLKEKGVLTSEEYDLKAAAIKDKLFNLKKEDLNKASSNEIVSDRKILDPNVANINRVNKASINSDENSNKTLYITFAVIIIFLIIGGFFVVKYQKTDTTNDEINSTGVVEFNQTEFADRNEELRYIREYFNQKFPDYAIKMIPPDQIEKVKQMFTALGKDYTTRQVVDTIIKSQHVSETFMANVIKKNLSFGQVKDNLENYSIEQYQKGVKSSGNLPVVNYNKTTENALQSLTDEEANNVIQKLKETPIHKIKETEATFDIEENITFDEFMKIKSKNFEADRYEYHVDKKENSAGELSITITHFKNNVGITNFHVDYKIDTKQFIYWSEFSGE